MIERVAHLSPAQVAAIARLVDDEERCSGRNPLDEVNRLALAGADTPPRRHWLLWDEADEPEALAAYAVASDDADVRTAELSARNFGGAVAMLDAVRADLTGGFLWAHGENSEAHLAATRTGLTCVRELVLLGRSLPLDHDPEPLAAGITVTSFDPERDSAEWLELNRTAFSDLPDQATWTRADLHLRLAAPWFEPDGFLVARADDDSLAGFHWTKIDNSAPTTGEVFVIAVAPQWRGTGLAQALLDRGLASLHSRGAEQVHLYVDRANARAVTLYERAGFTLVDTDRQYRL